MNNKKLYYYGNGGNIKEVIDRNISYNRGYAKSIYDMLNKIIDNSDFYKNMDLDIKDFKIFIYGYDKRLNKYVYMITCNKRLYKFKNQFVSYFIEED